MSNNNYQSLVRKELLKYGVATNMGLNEIIKERIANGEAIFHMAFGQSPFPVYEKAIEKLKDHAGENDYLPVAGIKELRLAIVEFHKRVDGIFNISPDDVIIGPGTKQLSFLLQEVFNGDIYILSPSWTTYKPQSVLAHKDPVVLNTSFEQGWKVDPNELDEKFSENKHRNKLLILINPDNPTGVAYTPEENRRIADVCRKHQALVLSDEIYSLLNFDNAHDSLFKHYPEGTILQNGLSKWASAGGWRLGYHIYPSQLSSIRNTIRSSASQTYSCAPAPVQFGALEYFRFDDECRQYVAHCNRILKAVSEFVFRELTSVGVKIAQPKGGFYMMPDFEVIRESLQKRGIATGKEMQEALLKESSVALLACGPAFLRPERELSFRLCYINFDGRKALEESRRLGLNCEINEEFIRINCKNTVDGVCAIKEWTLKHLNQQQ